MDRATLKSRLAFTARISEFSPGLLTSYKTDDNSSPQQEKFMAQVH